MACNLAANRARDCKNYLAGNSKLYLFNYVEDPFTYASGVVTAINASLTVCYEYELSGDNNTLVESQVSDDNTGTVVNTQTLTVELKKQDAATTAQMDLLCAGYAQAVVKDRNGIYHAVGINDGINWTVEQTTGGAKSDFHGYRLTGVATTGELSPKLDAASVTAWLLLVYAP